MLAIIIPAYNRGQDLEEALKSLMVQTKKRFITIIVDDASQEDLYPIVERYKSPLHIIYLKQESNQGPGAARERALQWCFDNNIEFVMFLDSDDLLLPKAVERLTKEINVTNCDIIISDIQGENKDGFSYSIPVSANETVWTHGKIYRVSFLKRIGLNFLKLKTNEDLAFNTVAFYAARKRGKIGYIEEQHYIWRHNKNSITRTKEKQEELICQLSKDFIRAISFSLLKFEELELDLSMLFPKIIGAYTYVQYLKILKKYDLDIEKEVQTIFSNSEIKNLIELQASKKENNIFLSTPQGTYFLNNKFIYEQSIQNFIFQYTGISI